MSQENLRKKFIEKGVKFTDANTVYLREDTEIESGVVIEPFVVLGSKVKIAKGSIIRSFSYLEDVTIGENVMIGPFARTRGSSNIGDNSNVGNFVEIVRSNIGENTAVAHLTYIGDAEVGNKVNVGAGLVICNYDGFNKHKSIIEDNCFIGSNSTIVSPVKVGKDALVAAGTVVTKNVEEDALAIARSELRQLKNGASDHRRRKSS